MNQRDRRQLRRTMRRQRDEAAVWCAEMRLLNMAATREVDLWNRIGKMTRQVIDPRERRLVDQDCATTLKGD